jgi:hypothetical protein
MGKIKDHYWRWLAEQLPPYDKIIIIGMMIWMIWYRPFHLPRPDLRESAMWWTSPVFFILGLAYFSYSQMSNWWMDLQINWVLHKLQDAINDQNKG